MIKSAELTQEDEIQIFSSYLENKSGNLYEFKVEI